MYQSLQGNLGLGKAINFFISEGYIVSIPLNDTQPYDIIVDKDGKLYKVSVKTFFLLTFAYTSHISARTVSASGFARNILLTIYLAVI